MSTNNSKIGGIHGFFDTLIDEDWSIACGKTSHTKKELMQMREYFKYSIHGLLLLYINGRKEMKFKDFIDEVESITGFYISLVGE